MDTDVGRQDRPAHIGETVAKERRRQPHDMVLGFEPGDEGGLRAVVAGKLAEPHEGGHLVPLARHRLHKGVCGMHIVISGEV